MVSRWEEDSQDLIADRDLELAAIFGKMLLDKNKELSDKNGYLEEQLIMTNDLVNRLRQRISVKNKLLKIYSQDIEDMEMEYDSLVNTQQSSDICQTSLKRKSNILEDNNQQLQFETFRLASLISEKEKNEGKLGERFLEKLAKMSDQADILVADLTDKTSENLNQEKTIHNLWSKIEKVQKENADLYSERLSNQKMVRRMESSLQELKKEVVNWKDKYDELLHLMEGIRGQFTSFQSWYKPKPPVIANISLASELEQSNHPTNNKYPYLHRSICVDEITDNCWYRGTPDGESESEHIAESTHVEKEMENQCLLVDTADENNSEEEKPKELTDLKEFPEVNSGSFDRQSEQWQSGEDNVTAKHKPVGSYVQSNMGNCFPKLFRRLEMVKQMEGSTILRQWQQLAVQPKGFALSSGLYTVLETSID